MGNKTINTVSLYLILPLLLACGGGGQDVEIYTGEIEDKISAETDVALDLVMYDIPSPIDVTKDISRSGAAYNKGILNAPDKAGSYTTTFKKAANLGVYVADMSYATVYDQTQDATSFLKASTQLADGVGISGAFDPEMMKKFEQNLGNQDSLAKLIDDAYHTADKFLRSNDRVSAAALVLSGGWVEGMYISTQVLGNSPKTSENQLIFKRLGSQKKPLQNMLNLLKQYKDNQEINIIYSALLELDTTTYKNILGPGYINESHIGKINEKISGLRTEIVK